MSDNLNIKRPHDSSRISLSEDWETRYWTKELNCTQEELNTAIKAVGNSAKSVRDFLNKNK